jgi:hypothetical protein
MQSLFLQLRSHLSIVAALGLGLATSCKTAGAPEPTAAAVPQQTAPAPSSSNETGSDTSCDRRSGVTFRVYYLTLRPHEKESVSIQFGEDLHAHYVPDYESRMASLRRGEELPNPGIYLTDSSSSLTVTISVVDTSTQAPIARPLGSVKVELPLKPHWLWLVTSRITPRRDREADEVRRGPPARSAATALAGGDSLFVTAYGSGRRCGPYLN